MKTYNKTYVLFISLVSAMGGLLFGYDWVVIGGAKPFYEAYFNLAGQPVQQGLAMSIALLGCLLGASLAGALADRIGRKRLLIAAALLFLVSSYATGAVNTFSLFLLARFFGGIGIGVASDLSPMYIAEVAPADIRGKFVSINQLTIVIGILAAQLVNWLIAEPVPAGPFDLAASWNGQYAWRWMFWATMVPSLLFLILAFFIPESPRWSALHNRRDHALSVWKRIGGEQYADAELKAVQTTDEGEKNVLKVLLGKPMRPVLILGIVLAVFQQWCGTNVIFNYAQEIFQSAGYTISDVLFNIVITGVANLAFTFVAIHTVDKLGRRALMLIGALGLCGIYLILGTCYFFDVHGWFMVFLVVLAIACYAMSLGPVTWVILSEIFPNRIRGAAMAVATFALWAACFVLTYTFPLLNQALGTYGTFWIYSMVCAFGAWFIWKKLPETKGKSLETIEQQLVKHHD